MWVALYSIWVVSELAILLFTRFRNSGARSHDRGSLFLLWPVIILSIWLGTWYGKVHLPNLFRSDFQAQTVSLLLLVIGLIIRWTAILKLGKCFTAHVAIRETQRIVRTGVFRVIRHPSYAGLLIIFTGVGLSTRNLAGLVIVLLPTTVALLYRIQVEEAVLSEAFGDEYLSYRRSTKRLIPGVY